MPCARHQVDEGIVRLGQVQVHRVHHLLRGMRAGHGQHLRVHLAHQVAAVVARLGAQAAGDDDLAVLGQRLADRVQAFLHRVVDEAAGVDDHQVGAGVALAGRVALGARAASGSARNRSAPSGSRAKRSRSWGRGRRRRRKGLKPCRRFSPIAATRPCEGPALPSEPLGAVVHEGGQPGQHRPQPLLHAVQKFVDLGIGRVAA